MGNKAILTIHRYHKRIEAALHNTKCHADRLIRASALPLLICPSDDQGAVQLLHAPESAAHVHLLAAAVDLQMGTKCIMPYTHRAVLPNCRSCRTYILVHINPLGDGRRDPQALSAGSFLPGSCVFGGG